MNIVEDRFTNFKKFINNAVPLECRGNPLLVQMETVPLPMFLSSVHSHQAEGCSEIFGGMLEKMDLKEGDISKADIQKLWRYIQYFKEVAKEIYG